MGILRILSIPFIGFGNYKTNISIILYDFQRICIGELRESIAYGILIPETYGGEIVLQGQIAPSAPPAQRLDGHPDILLKIDRVCNMPAVHGKPLLGLV